MRRLTLAKTAAQSRFARGQVTIGVQAKRAEAGAAALTVNGEVLNRYLRLANELVEGGAAPATSPWEAFRCGGRTSIESRQSKPRAPGDAG